MASQYEKQHATAVSPYRQPRRRTSIACVLRDLITAWRFLLKRPHLHGDRGAHAWRHGRDRARSRSAPIDQAFWRPADAARGGELVTFYSSRPSAPFYQTLSYPDYVDIRDRLRDRVELAALVRVENTLGGGEWPTRAWGELVSGNYFSVLGTRPFAGRLLGPDDDRVAGAQPVIVLGHDFWRRQFNGDPAVIGGLVRLGGRDFSVVGIAPRGFQGPAWPSDFWIPLAMTRQVMGADVLPRSDAPILQTVGRLAPGVATAQIESHGASVETFASRAGWQLRVFPSGVSQVLAGLPIDGRAVSRHLRGSRRLRAPHRVRQSRRPPDCPRRRAPARACHPSGARRDAPPAAPTPRR